MFCPFASFRLEFYRTGESQPFFISSSHPPLYRSLLPLSPAIQRAYIFLAFLLDSNLKYGTMPSLVRRDPACCNRLPWRVQPYHFFSLMASRRAVLLIPLLAALRLLQIAPKSCACHRSETAACKSFACHTSKNALLQPLCLPHLRHPPGGMCALLLTSLPRPFGCAVADSARGHSCFEQ